MSISQILVLHFVKTSFGGTFFKITSFLLNLNPDSLKPIFFFLSDDDMDSENRTALSGDEADEAHEQEDEKWRVERLEREKWIQGKTLSFGLMNCLGKTFLFEFEYFENTG